MRLVTKQSLIVGKDKKSAALKNVGLVFLCSTAIVLSSCASKEKRKSKAPTAKISGIAKDIPHINNKTKFSSKEFGVKGSPRVTQGKSVRKGGGRYQVGKPYTIRGKRYYPKEDKNLKQVGMASWYGPNFHGRLTANGEVYDQYSLSAAHPTMPLPSYAKVTNLENGRTVTVRVNDRGPYAHGRVIDLSAQAAKMLDYTHKGVTKVKVTYVGKARMDGLDQEMLMATYKGPNDSGLPSTTKQPAPSTMIAMVDTATIPNKTSHSTRSALTPSLEVGTNASATAIDGNFSQNNQLPISLVPIPTSRPEIFEPVEQNGVVSYQVIRKPLAYISEQKTLTFAEFSTKNSIKYSSLELYSNKLVQLELGTFRRESDKHAIANLFAGSSKVVFKGNRALLRIREDQANLAMDYAIAIGLNSVKFL